MTTVPLSAVPKNLRPAVIAAAGRGWVLERTKKHLRLRHPDRGFIVFPKTPSEYRGLKNLQADLKRAERVT